MVASVIAAEKSGSVSQRGVIRPWLGITAQDVTSDIAESLGLERPSGVLVADLHSASPLKTAGLRQGDIVIAMNGREVHTAAEMKFRMATVPLGGKAEVEFMRKGKRRIVSVEATTPPETPARATTTLENAGPLSGVEIANINPAVIAELGLNEKDSGVVVTGLSDQGRHIVREGDILLKINGAGITDVKSAAKAAASISQTQGLNLVINRNGRVQQIMIR